MDCLATLPQEQREVVVLKIWHEHTFEQIADLLGISANTIAGRYRYALQKLRKSLKDIEYETHGRVREGIALVGATPPIGGA